MRAHCPAQQGRQQQASKRVVGEVVKLTLSSAVGSTSGAAIPTRVAKLARMAAIKKPLT